MGIRPTALSCPHYCCPGDALYAMELALALEKLNFSKLRELHATARACEDPELQDFVNAKLHEQVGYCYGWWC